jgi:2-isopropylmalate synthase
MQNDGYDFDAAGGSLELLIREALNPDARPFEIAGFEVTTRMIGPDRTQSTASVSVRIQEAILVGEAVCGGPINALDTALRKCLSNLYPAVMQVKLTDYRVQILEPQKGTAARAAYPDRVDRRPVPSGARWVSPITSSRPVGWRWSARCVWN